MRSKRSTLSPTWKLRATLSGHQGTVLGLAWSPDGAILASCSTDKTIRLTDPVAGVLRSVLQGHAHDVAAVAWSPDGQWLASASADATIRLWDGDRPEARKVFKAHLDCVSSLAWSPQSRWLASSGKDQTIYVWNVATGEVVHVLKGHAGWVYSLAWSPQGQVLASGAKDETIRLWDLETGKLLRTLRSCDGGVFSLAWFAQGKGLVASTAGRTIQLWDPNSGLLKSVIEGHTGWITSVSFSTDERILVSKSNDGTVRLWDCETLEAVAFLREPYSSAAWPLRIAFNPNGPGIATLGEDDAVVRIWDLEGLTSGSSSTELIRLLGSGAATAEAPPPAAPVRPAQPARPKAIHYANAKVVLLGDTGVGKSGLALALTGQPFAATESTHARRVWTFESRVVEAEGLGNETREIMLWDLAGQPGYRLIHQLHLHEVALALVVFDSRSETDPFAGVQHWVRALRQARRLQGDSAPPLKKLLVAARADRGGVAVGRSRIEGLVRELEFDGYYETSAKEGWQIAELTEAIRSAIDWKVLPHVSSNELFQGIREFLVQEKEAGRLLSTATDLHRSFRLAHPSPGDPATQLAEFETCIGRLEASGLIRRLSFGRLVLLQPELLDAYASAIINAAREEPDGLGSISEEDARLGRFRMPSEVRVRDKEDEQFLLVATIEDLLRHEIALREQGEDGPQLVFPSQFTREHPELPDPPGKTINFSFAGPVLNIYTTLAVRLSRSGVFGKEEWWRNAATFSARVGGACGMFLREREEGQGELTLFFSPQASEETRFQFEQFIEAHLQRRALAETVQRERLYSCVECGTGITSLQAQRRRERGFSWMECNVCGARILLLDRKERLDAATVALVKTLDRAADAQREYEAGLVSAAAEMQTHGFKEWGGTRRVTLALIFSEIINSAALAQELGDSAMEELRAAHFVQAQKLVEEGEGYFIRSIDNAFLAAFRTASGALDFALALRRDTGHPRVRIRACLHVGLVQMEGQEALGRMVNYAARIESFAQRAPGPQAGGIWLSSRAKQEIDQAGPPALSGLSWTEHPGCELKGFPGSHTLWSVSAAAPETRAAQPAAAQ